MRLSLAPIIQESATMSHFHAVVWLDHSEAHVMHISPDDVEKSVIHPARPHQHLHARSGSIGAGRKDSQRPSSST